MPIAILCGFDRDGVCPSDVSIRVGCDGGLELDALVVVNNAVLSGRMSFDVSLSGEQQWRQDSSVRDAFLTTASGTWSQKLQGGASLSVTGYAQDSASDSAYIASETLGAEIRFSPENPIIGKTRVEFSLGYQERKFDLALPLLGTREDERISAAATFFIQDVEYFGFSPTATINATRNDSSLSVYETEEVGLSLGLRSSF